MQKIILSDGKVFDINVPNSEEGYFRTLQKAVMIDDGVDLKESWVYEFIERDQSVSPNGINFVDYYVSDTELTKEQMVFQMVKRNLGMYDVVIPHKAYVITYNDDE